MSKLYIFIFKTGRGKKEPISHLNPIYQNPLNLTFLL